MKYHFFLVLLTATTILLSAQGKTYQSSDPLLSTYRKDATDGYSWRQREIRYVSSNTTLTVEKLLSTRWVGDPVDNPNIVMTFFKDGIFKYGSVQGGAMIFGSYRIDDGQKVILMRDKVSFQNAFQGFENTDVTLNFSGNSENLFYSDHLFNDKIDLFAVGSEQKEGFRTQYLKTTIEKLTAKRVATDNIFFRKSPSKSGDKFTYSFYETGSSFPPGLLFRGTQLDVSGRTVTQDTIDGITSSWYLVRFPTEDTLEYGWVFGGYTSMYDENRSSQYEGQLKSEMEKSRKK
jgi:hypothetical protein